MKRLSNFSGSAAKICNQICLVEQLILSHQPQCRDPMRLHHPIPKPEFNARSFPLREKTCLNSPLQNISKNRIFSFIDA